MIEDKSYGIIVVLRKESEEDRFLILRQTNGHWSFPKGHKEGDESDKESALRELAEETGITEVIFADLPNVFEDYEVKVDGSLPSGVTKQDLI